MNIDILNPMIEIDIDMNVDLCFNYYCEICCMEFNVKQTKYKCENEKCDKKMCDSCYEEWLKTKYENTCVYCRSPLEITIYENETNISMEEIHIGIENINRNITRNRNSICYGIACSVSYFGTTYLIGWAITQRTDSIFSFFNFLIGMLITIMAWGICINLRTRV